MLKGRSSVDSCTILHICMSLLCPQSHLSTASSSTSLMPSTWFITNPDFILKTTFMNHDLGSGGNAGLQISDLDVDKVSPPKHNWWCQKWTHFHHLLWMQTKLFRYIMMVIWDFTTETFVYSQCGCLVGSCLLHSLILHCLNLTKCVAGWQFKLCNFLLSSNEAATHL